MRQLRSICAFIGLLFVMGTVQAQEAGLITKVSPHTVADTAARLQQAIEGAGATLFGVIDHQAGAESVGMELAPSTLVVFGNPKLGTPLMKANPEIGLDLPMRVLIFDDGGETKLTYYAAGALKARYGIVGVDQVFETMAGALDKLTNAAIAQ